jgi:hypothetical protein
MQNVQALSNTASQQKHIQPPKEIEMEYELQATFSIAMMAQHEVLDCISCNRIIVTAIYQFQYTYHHGFD